MHGSRTNKVKKYEISKMFLRRRLCVCALCETKLLVKCEVMFDEVVDRVSGVEGGRAKEGIVQLLSGWLLRYLVEWKEVSSRIM